jgi:hypothetical protein
MQDDFMTKWKHFIAAVNADAIIGPLIVPNNKTGESLQGLAHSGFSLELAMPDIHIVAPIFMLGSKNLGYWATRQAVILAGDIECPALLGAVTPDSTTTGVEVISLYDLLGKILRNRAKPFPHVLELVVSLDPFYEHQRASPLKRNAFQTLMAKYSEIGFATAPVKLGRKSASMRLVWVYPKHRTNRATSNYLTVGFLRFKIDAKGGLTDGSVEFPWYDQIAGALNSLFAP